MSTLQKWRVHDGESHRCYKPTSGEHVSCERFETQLHNFKSSSTECTSLLMRATPTSVDGWLESEAFVSCSCCVRRQPVFPLAFVDLRCSLSFDFTMLGSTLLLDLENVGHVHVRIPAHP